MTTEEDIHKNMIFEILRCGEGIAMGFSRRIADPSFLSCRKNCINGSITPGHDNFCASLYREELAMNPEKKILWSLPELEETVRVSLKDIHELITYIQNYYRKIENERECTAVKCIDPDSKSCGPLQARVERALLCENNEPPTKLVRTKRMNESRATEIILTLHSLYDKTILDVVPIQDWISK